MLQTAAGVSSQAKVAYQVDDLHVDVARAQVTRAGAVLPLPRLSFDLLLALIEAAPRIVSPDELMDKVWATVVVSPETVSQRVKLLRDALGDDPRTPRYVAGVRGRGYRLVSNVAALSNAAATTSTTGEPSSEIAAGIGASSPATSRSRGMRVAAVILGIAVLLVAISFLARRPSDQQDTGDVDTGSSAVPASPRSVAVLPFESLGDAGREDVLAFGIAEAVLHRLANLHELEVIARTSSFSMQGKQRDVREIGRALKVRYVLEGSVQHDGDRLRVTAQLIDTQTGSHLWSVQFDRTRADVFAMQDEIATRVARALQLSLDANATGRLDEQSTQDFDAYLAYLQGRALLATGRVGDARKAVERFNSALRLDPAFTAAYVSLAEADVFAMEFDAADDRTARFDAAGRRAVVLLARALQLDPDYGPAYLMRGYLEAFSDLQQAEASYRRGLELRPNDAMGYAGLATVLFEQPSKRAEALEMLERARRLDPLEPMHDVRKAVFLLYDRGDVRGADSLLRQVLRRQPLYLPAITRLAEIAWCCDSNPSEAIQYFEQAIVLDPLAHWPRRPLVSAYLDVGDERAAKDVVDHTTRSPDVLRVPLFAYAGDWRRAGEAAYQALAKELVTPIDETIVVLSIRRHARLTGEYSRAIAAMEQLSGVRWTADEAPIIPERRNPLVSAVGLADMLQRAGDTLRAQALLQMLTKRIQDDLRTGQLSELWYYGTMSTALALAGERNQALAWLERGVAAGVLRRGSADMLEGDPAFDDLKGMDRFRALLDTVHRHAAKERAELEQLRAAGLAPRRE